jgi:hypothetical protein
MYPGTIVPALGFQYKYFPRSETGAVEKALPMTSLTGFIMAKKTMLFQEVSNCQ